MVGHPVQAHLEKVSRRRVGAHYLLVAAEPKEKHRSSFRPSLPPTPTQSLRGHSLFVPESSRAILKPSSDYARGDKDGTGLWQCPSIPPCRAAPKKATFPLLSLERRSHNCCFVFFRMSHFHRRVSRLIDPGDRPDLHVDPQPFPGSLIQKISVIRYCADNLNTRHSYG
jgi:hypothetical protein